MVQCGKTKHFESLDKISWNQFFKKIRAITIQCNLVRNALISRKCEKNIAIESNFCNIHTMQCNAMQTWSKIANIHCGNYWILLPRFFRKNSVKSTSYKRTFLWIDLTKKKCLDGNEFLVFRTHTLEWKLRNFTAA